MVAEPITFSFVLVTRPKYRLILWKFRIDWATLNFITQFPYGILTLALLHISYM